jgi:hypothetical protein
VAIFVNAGYAHLVHSKIDRMKNEAGTLNSYRAQTLNHLRAKKAS